LVHRVIRVKWSSRFNGSTVEREVPLTRITVVPAYGRDYESRAEVEQAVLVDQKDFLIRDVSCRWNGAYVSARDLQSGDVLNVRYNRLTQSTEVRIP